MVWFNKTNLKLACLLILSTTTSLVATVCTKSSENCVNANSTICPSKARCLDLFWMEMSPYSYLDENGNVTGIIVDIFKMLLQRCCAECAELVETAPVNSLELQHTPAELSELILPYRLSASQQSYFNGYIAIVKEPSSAYIKKEEHWVAHSRRLLTMIFAAWPIICMALLLSLLSGIIIWALETWFNPEQFPRKFCKGAWEGFWWAFVSMTTVGYGDRSPTSFLGRSFAVCWIIIGVCICSIFTASLTSAITSSNIEEDKTINTVKVGVLFRSLEAHVGIANRAELAYYNSTDELWQALISDEVEGILFDSYYSNTMEADEMMKNNNLRVVTLFESKDWSYGVLLSHEQLASCMNEVYNRDYTEIFSTARASEKRINHNAEHDTEVSLLFDSNRNLFKVISIACGACAVTFIIIGLCWDQFGKKVSLCKNSSTAPINTELTKLQEIENEVMLEVQSIFTSWKNKIAEKKNISQENYEKEDNV